MLQQKDISLSDWQIMELYSTANGSDFILSDSSYWRMVKFIEKAESHEKIKSHSHAYEIGRGLGKFHCLLSDLPPHKLHDTLPGFHQTPEYLKIYDMQPQATGETIAEVKFCRKFIDRRRTLVPVLEKAKQHLPLRSIHGDPKINNIMTDRLSGRVVSLIDLDTVKPGLVHYDIGDCLRSCCNPLGEDINDPQKIFFDLDLCRLILQGYFSEADNFFTPLEYDYIFKAINLIPFELGLRFFSDYLSGNIYFKTSDKDRNLRRAIGQFYLTRSIEKQEKRIREIITDIKG
jgi:Ser/Thr protein kinase RdoA (MazF antagonist)